MVIKTVSKWYFGSEDKEEVKKYSREISVLFKLNGYNPAHDVIYDFFEIYDFEFIPCVREGLQEVSEDDFDNFEEDVETALDSAYDPSTQVTFEDLERYAESKNKSVKSLLTDLIDGTKMDSFVDFFSSVDFANSSGLEIQKKFVNWIFNKG